MAELVIREALPEEAERLAKLAFETFWDAFHSHPKNRPEDMKSYMDSAFSIDQIARELAQKNNIFFIAEFDGEAAGYSKLIIDSIESGIKAERPIELARLYSHQKFLGKGIGQALLDKCLHKARDLGRDVIWLGVWEYNPRARKFYEKNGFTYVGQHIFQLGSDPQIDLLMQRQVS
jgi:ribosomal protein S18 acetylase RimI-like enzyme